MKRLILVFLCIFCLLVTAVAAAEANRVISFDTDIDPVLYVGKTLKVSASVEKIGEDAPSKTTLSWSTSDKSVAKISNPGQITAVAPGTVTITCYAKDDDTIAQSFELEVRANVSSVVFEEKTISLLLGSTDEKKQATLVPKISPENAFEQGVVWASSDESVVTVSQDGVITAVQAGKAEITAVSADEKCKKNASCTVNVLEAVNGIQLNDVDEHLYVGAKVTLTADVMPESATNKAVSWESSDSSVATVAKGVVTIKAPGNAVITATAQDGSGVTAECKIHAISAVKSVKLSESKAVLVYDSETGREMDLTCTVSPENAFYQDVLWASSDETIATVDDQGHVTALAPGKVTITASTTDPKSKATAASCTITVGKSVKSIKLEDKDITIHKGKTAALKPVVSPEDAYNTGVSFESSDPTVVTVDSKGKLTAKGVGTATITCKAKDGSDVEEKVTVTVIQNVTKVSSNMGKVVLFEEETLQLSVSVAPADATNKEVEWTSSNESVIRVDSNGKITARKAGTANVTAAAKDGSGKSYTFKVTVEPDVPIELVGLGTGVFQPNLLGLTVKNKCKTKTITDFTFDMELSVFSSISTSGSYNLGSKKTSIGPGAKKTIKRNASGVGYSTKYVITITSVTFKDGTVHYIPKNKQQKTVWGN